MKISIKNVFAIFTLFLSSAAFAGGVVKFTEAEFTQLKQSNASVLIDVHATWCPTCKKQGRVITEFFKQNPDSDLTVLKVDYDTQKKWVKYFKAPRQSTLIKYQGEKEVGRVIAQTSQDKLFELFEMTEAK